MIYAYFPSVVNWPSQPPTFSISRQTSWMHPRSKKGYMIDYVITKNKIMMRTLTSHIPSTEPTINGTMHSYRIKNPSDSFIQNASLIL